MLCAPDALLILVAFFFLLLAAAAQIYIPTYTGRILDKLSETFNGDDDTSHKSMKDVPGFMQNVRKLIAASILGGVFSGVRGSVFTIVGARANVRLRLQLLDSLLVQGRICPVRM
jgi:ATP-binding cassette subfamily B (MDR/TAP) protein 9